MFRVKFQAVVSAVFLSSLFASSVSEAVLFIDPTRLVLEGRTRSGTITFLNQKSTTATYRMFWREMRQGVDGKLVPIKEGESAPWSAQHLLRYSPRQATLGPQESQIVRFALRKPKDLKEGEYRSHLVIQEQPPAGQDPNQDPNEPGEVGFQVNFVYGYTIPIVVVHGDLQPKAIIRNMETRKISEDEWELSAVIGNSGGASSMGIIRLEWEDSDGVQVVGEGGAHNLYLPQREQAFTVKYKKPDTPGRLRVAYYDDRYAKRKTAELPSTELLAEAYLK